MILELSRLLPRLGLTELDEPLALLIVPVATNHLYVEGHVFS